MDLGELTETASAQIEGLSGEKLVMALESLTDVELRDGKIVELVRRDNSGRWRARAV